MPETVKPLDKIDVKRPSKPPKQNLFKIKKANEWIDLAKATPTPKMLFSEFWHEGEICILFASSNLGKSILAVQIANSISSGEAIVGFKLEAEKQPVLYFDFELSEKQFEIRYSEKDEANKTAKNHYIFNDNFLRVEIDRDAQNPLNLSKEAYLKQSIEDSIKSTGAKVLIIDNITYLRGELEKSSEAWSLIDELKVLKKKYNLSILILAHTPKRDFTKPISSNDLSGSSAVMNFIDSCFTIGKSSKDPKLRYIKQIKARNTDILFDSENIILAEIEKPRNFLSFSFTGYGNEKNHLKEINKNDKEAIKQKVFSLKKQGKSGREIARIVGLSHTSINKIYKEMETGRD